MAAAFGADLNKPPVGKPPMPEWIRTLVEARGHIHDWRRENWARSMHSFVERTEQKASRIFGPFSGYLEMDLPLQAVMHRFGPAIGEPLGQARAAWSEMISELLQAMYPDAAGRSVSAEVLRRHGFDPDAPQPDPDDYF